MNEQRKGGERRGRTMNWTSLPQPEEPLAFPRVEKDGKGERAASVFLFLLLMLLLVDGI